MTIFDAISDLSAQCEAREQEFCIEKIDIAVISLQGAIQALEAQRTAYLDGRVANLVACDRHRRIALSAGRLLDHVEGREIKLFPV